MLTVGDTFPAFQCQACAGVEPSDLTVIETGSYEGRWKLFLFYPKDFTFVCPTELVEFGNRAGDFEDKNVVLIGGSTDNEYSHLAWRQNHPQLKSLPYPLIAAQKLAQDLGIVHPTEHVCLRATFLVDPDGVIQHVTVNDLSTGRNVDEMLRVVGAVQSGDLTPCNWSPGDEVLKV